MCDPKEKQAVSSFKRTLGQALIGSAANRVINRLLHPKRVTESTEEVRDGTKITRERQSVDSSLLGEFVSSGIDSYLLRKGLEYLGK